MVLAAMASPPATVLAESSGPAGRDFSNNFGFPLSFDVSKMDRTVDPRQDF